MSERFPNNSRFGAAREKQPSEEKIEPKKEKVIEGTAMRRKRPIGEKFRDTFVQGDVKSVGSHILNDILIPSAIETLGDMGHNLVDGMIYGDDAPARSRSSRRRRNMARESTSIDRGTGRASKRPYQAIHNRRSLSFDDVIVDTYDEAILVLDELQEDIEEYGQARVSTLYRAVGWDNYVDYTTDGYGWFNLNGVRPVQVRVDGETKYTLNLPRAEQLE